MSKNRKNRILIWAIAFALSVFLTLIIPTHYSSNIFGTLVFDAIAYIAVLILWIKLFRNTKMPADAFYNSSAMTISIVYLIIQTLLCVIVGLLVDEISFKTTLILNVVLMVVMWFLIHSTIIAKDHAKHVDSRQKDHHVEL